MKRVVFRDNDAIELPEPKERNLGGTASRVTLPRVARDGLMRAWLTILRERHPHVTWIPANENIQRSDEDPVN